MKFTVNCDTPECDGRVRIQSGSGHVNLDILEELGWKYEVEIVDGHYAAMHWFCDVCTDRGHLPNPLPQPVRTS